MKKGELRREAIVRTAEELFFEKGYEETSIQDILDELRISKGGFYHHFDSKISLLEEICRKRCERELERLRAGQRGGKLAPVRKLDALLSTLLLLEHSDPDFAALVLKVSYLDGDVQFRDRMRAFRTESLREMVNEAIGEGMEDGSLFTRHPGALGEMLMQLVCDLNDAVCGILAKDYKNPDCAIEIVALLDAYREAVETLSGARFGEIALLDLEHFMEAIRLTSQELEQMKGRA